MLPENASGQTIQSQYSPNKSRMVGESMRSSYGKLEHGLQKQLGYLLCIITPYPYHLPSLYNKLVQPKGKLRDFKRIILIGGIKLGDLVLSIVERCLIQCPFLGVSSLRGSTVFI